MKNHEKPLNILAQGAQGDRERKKTKNGKKPEKTGKNRKWPKMTENDRNQNGANKKMKKLKRNTNWKHNQIVGTWIGVIGPLKIRNNVPQLEKMFPIRKDAPN